MHTTKRFVTPRTFSLVELLIIVGIISILASLLLPALHRARGQAEKVSCINNEKQLHVWAMVYADEWNQVLPFNGGTDTSIHAYKRCKDNTKWYQRSEYYDVSQRLTGGTIMQCSNTMRVVEPKYVTNSWAKTYFMSSYLGGNVNGFNDGAGYGWDSLPRKDRVSQQAWLFADGALEIASGKYRPQPGGIMGMPREYNEGGPFFWKPTNVNYGRFYGAGHPHNSANIIFVDGHAENMTRQDLAYRYHEITSEAGTNYWTWDEVFQGGRNMSNN